MDDFNMPLEYVMNFTKAGFQGKSGMIFAQYAEHRLVPSKLIYISYYYITGGLNFRILGILGDLQLLVVAFVGIHFIKKYLPESWRLLAFIWALVVFDLNTYENACMTMNAMGNYGVICYFFAALYFYDKEDRWIPIAVLFQFFCIFSNANGLAAGVFIALFNIAKSPRKRTISLIASCIFIGLYFINFHTVTLPNKLPFDLNLPVIFFIRQSGAHFSFNNSLLIGLLVLALLAVLFPWRQLFQPRFTPILCIFLFPLCTMFLAAAFRSCYSDAQFQTSRYLMYPQMMIGCLCLFAWMKLKSVLQKRVGGSVIVGIMLFAYAGNYKFGKLGFERTNYHATTVKFWHPHPAECEKICKEACERDIYCIEDNK
ncbi:MAG TPA: hypothetical protein VNS58_32295 [Puia sp.]|nr:hypothetical protein [Puia sp.]